MKRKGRLFFPVLAVAAGLLAYILFPLTSRKWDIHFNEKKIAYKKEFLDKIQRLSSRRSTGQRPNFLVILADDLGKYDMSFYGGTAVDTPNIDSIGHTGVVFTEAYCTSPICSPSRASLLTGRYQQRYGYEVQPQSRYAYNRLEYFVVKHFIDTGDWILDENVGTPRRREIEKQGLPPSEITLAELLQRNGYATGITGKWHLGYSDQFVPNHRGFDYQYGFYEAFSLYAPIGTPGIVEYRHDYFANKHIWKQERKGPCAIRRNNQVIEDNTYLTWSIEKEACGFLENHRTDPFFLFVPFSAPHTPFQAPQEYYDRYSSVEDKDKRMYYAMISALDDAVGIILGKLKDLGLEENTVVLFASDNGGAAYTGATDNYPLKGGKFTNFEGGINIPAMIRWKGKIEPGIVFRQPVSLMDYFMTIVRAADIRLPDDREYDGKDLMPYITGTVKGPPHRALYWRSAYNKAVRIGRWKLILDEKSGRTLLYDMQRNNYERENLAGEHPEVIRALEKELSVWEKKLISPLWPRVMDYRFHFDGEEYDFAL